ncbi:hypothetical protein JL722_13772 [Aureococcus anophagefferens]|nr:hypothetical protein JL722_13772 [Aureococcus anophagefferens]
MPGEGKHDDDESCDDSLSLASSAPEAPPPKKSGAEGITVFLRMRPTKKPSKYYDISDAEGKKGQALKWDIPAEAVTRDGEYINNTRTKFAFKFDSILPMDIDQEQVSYMEIYNEQGFDLLDPSHETKQLTDLPRVKMMEDENGNFHLKNLSMHRAGSEEDALNLLFLGDTNRAISETAMNQASSRSHCMFTIFLEGRRAGSDRVLRSKLHMVDLAGSERVHKTKSDGVTLREAQYINTSLFYLEMRVALVKNDAHVNEETDPFVTIRRLKGEVATLRAEVTFLKGEAGEGASLTDGERGPRGGVPGHVDSRDAHETLRVSPLTLTRIKDCFAILKNMAKGGGPLPTLGKDASSPGSRPRRRRTPARPRARSAATPEVLAEKRRQMRVSDVGGVDFSLPPKEAAGIRDDPQKAYAYFRERCRTNGAIEDNKAVLKAKYGEAKMYGERVNSSRKSIAYLKQTIEQLRRERAMEGVSGDDDDGEPPPPTAEEEKKKEAIEVEKRVYKGPEKLRGSRARSSTSSALETGRARLQSDFDAPKPPKLTGNEDADDDIRAFYAAKEQLAVLQAKR